MDKLKPKQDSPGVVIPPPAIYAVIFVSSVMIQRSLPLNNIFFYSIVSKITGIFLMLISLFFSIRSLRQFFLSKNTLILIRPASSLQTSGIYRLTRNPMYTALVLLYLGLTFLIGNWWNLILFPLLILIVQEYIIKREEKYLERAFGQEYLNYKLKVRRWI